MNNSNAKAPAQWADAAKWAAICAAVVVVVATIGGIYVLTHWKIVGADTKVIIGSLVTEVKSSKKLVVLTAHINTDVKVTSTINLPMGIPLPGGATQILLIARDNRIQYFVDLDHFSAQDFEILDDKVIVTIPQPQLDEGMIVVQSDPNQIEIMTTAGVFRNDSEEWRNFTKAQIRQRLLIQGRADWLQTLARENAILQMKNLLTPLVKQGAELTIRFKEK